MRNRPDAQAVSACRRSGFVDKHPPCARDCGDSDFPDGRAGSLPHVNMASMQIGKDACSISRVPAGEVEAAVIAQVRKVLQAPEVMSQAIREVVALDPTADAQETILTLQSIEAVWDDLFDTEQARIIQLPVERVTVSSTGLRIDVQTACMKDLSVSVLQHHIADGVLRRWSPKRQ